MIAFLSQVPRCFESQESSPCREQNRGW